MVRIICSLLVVTNRILGSNAFLSSCMPRSVTSLQMTKEELAELINTRFDKLDADIKTMKNDLKTISETMTKMEEKMTTMNKTMNRIDRRTGGLVENFSVKKQGVEKKVISCPRDLADMVETDATEHEKHHNGEKFL